MSKHSDYAQSKIYTQLNKEELLKKLNHSHLTSTEFAEIVTYKNKERGSNKTCSRKTVENYIKKICAQSEKELNTNDLKDKHGSYILIPEIHNLLLVLFTTQSFDGRHKRKPISVIELDSKILETIELYLDEQTLAKIKCNSAYERAHFENKLYKNINKEFEIAINHIFSCEPITRFGLLLNFYNFISNFNKEQTHLEKEIIAAQNNLLRKEQSILGETFWSQEFTHQSLEGLLINLIVERLNIHYIDTFYNLVCDTDDVEKTIIENLHEQLIVNPAISTINSESRKNIDKIKAEIKKINPSFE
ncbi:hypothetical protein [Bacillus sp. FDAARGOS_235]|uniref:hypothetical protein n=1 Tax=Bacillus sp. FDAARGOS_235 TaxID=1839798 RepID=UPI00119FEC58|nr:hypothetical protein [Bacillus sp. FDAARGOS_235]